MKGYNKATNKSVAEVLKNLRSKVGMRGEDVGNLIGGQNRQYLHGNQAERPPTLQCF